jgi:deoxyadenosine/deoxycytidine kinase
MSTPPLTVIAPATRPPLRYIAIEGAIGVGKTALATRLAQRWSMQTLFDASADNPFLERFYRDMTRHALSAQLRFALQREDEAQRVAALRATDTPLVTDFLPQKTDLFANLTLGADELSLYRALAARLAATAPPPELVVYLQATPEVLFARIQKRANPAELQMPDAFLRALCDSYNEFFYHYDDAPVLTVSAEHLNPLDSDDDLALIAGRIETMRGRKEFFVKGTSL